ncbi:iron-containing alcohol dehydrogenase [Paenibacillus sp. NEAU-GSW1]|uniref:iron-containing alcohol dehydrogenase n=1 Tax=Paenibacillus sp. NEAU-GSW1 TaxID=2682486 RepID=UPI0012E22519|nr:iron-containing alcohol dehydrogenase [Paenibacillus sp. NEAU-GSW1]MUT66436.1 iron-containing alcohol dehydrogenase [Paenibacillus sp. NEAU-GSW1]
MRPFSFYNPTRLYFGAGQLNQLSAEAAKRGKNVLLVYGGGSIKRNGLYDQVIEKLNEAGSTITELAGVEPNPRITTVHRGQQLCKEHNIDWVLAVGGGSTIDCAKAIVAAAKFDGDFWDVIINKATVQDALPLGTVLTLAATGSEMNTNSVISNAETLEKHGWGSPFVSPAFSILDPAFTASAPKDHTVYGMVDMMAHVFEQYFHHDAATPVQDGFSESIMRAVIEVAPKLVDDLTNLQYRETILYSGTMALNGVLSMGIVGDWANHDMEHAVSAVYDIPHGGGLAILFPNWMKYVLDDNVARFKQFAVNVFGVSDDGRSDREMALEGIEKLRAFWNSIGAPSRLADYGIDDSRLEEMAEKVTGSGTRGNFRKLTKEDVIAIYRMSL